MLFEVVLFDHKNVVDRGSFRTSIEPLLNPNDINNLIDYVNGEKNFV